MKVGNSIPGGVQPLRRPENIRYLQQCCPELEIVETDLKSRPAFLDGGVDLVYMGSATERGLQLMVEALTPYRDALAD